jgi:hypothetical protein
MVSAGLDPFFRGNSIYFFQVIQYDHFIINGCYYWRHLEPGHHTAFWVSNHYSDCINTTADCSDRHSQLYLFPE